MNEQFVAAMIIDGVLLIIVFGLLYFIDKQNRRSATLQTLLNQSVVNSQKYEELYTELVKEHIVRAQAIEDASLRRQGIEVPGQKIEPRAPREHKPVGAAARLARYLDGQPKPAEPVRTVRPTDSKVS